MSAFTDKDFQAARFLISRAKTTLDSVEDEHLDMADPEIVGGLKDAESNIASAESSLVHYLDYGDTESLRDVARAAKQAIYRVYEARGRVLANNPADRIARDCIKSVGAGTMAYAGFYWMNEK